MDKQIERLINSLTDRRTGEQKANMKIDRHMYEYNTKDRQKQIFSVKYKDRKQKG